jgi:hypothetical protein
VEPRDEPERRDVELERRDDALVRRDREEALLAGGTKAPFVAVELRVT